MSKVDKYREKVQKRLEGKIIDLYEDVKKNVDSEYNKYMNGWDEIIDGKTFHHKSYNERVLEQYQLWKDGAIDVDEIVSKSILEGVDISKMWYYKKWQNGTLTDKDFFDRWMLSQEGRGQYWKDLSAKCSERIAHAGEIASDIINGEMPKVYSMALNDLGQKAMEEATKQGYFSFRFDMMDDRTLNEILSGKQTFAVYKERFKYDKLTKECKVEYTRDYKFNQEKFQSALAKSVANGEGPVELAGRLEKVVNMKKSAAIGVARTALTQARNAGQQSCAEELAEQGCITTKIWIDVHDSVPPERPAHWTDGHNQEVPWDEPFIVGGEELMFPGDTMRASPWNTFRCRCRREVGSKFVFRSTVSESQRGKIHAKVVK